MLSTVAERINGGGVQLPLFLTPLLLSILLLGSCAFEDRGKGERIGPCPGGSVLEFPAVEVRHAVGFQVESVPGGRLVTVKEPSPGAPTERYLLLPCNAPRPESHPDALVVEVPVQRVVTTSTTEIPHLESLGLLDRLVGHTGLSYVSSAAVARMAAEGQVAEMGRDLALDVERILAASPSLVLADSPGDSSKTAPERLRRAGVPVVLAPSYLETTPLGRAEWIKLTALFFGRETEAETLFTQVEEVYGELARRAATAAARPTVVANGPLGDTWWVPGGRSFAAALIRDAGGDYLWSEDDQAGSLPLALETVYARASEAEIWLASPNWPNLDHVLAVDRRFKAFRAVREGRIYAPGARLSKAGGNDFWELGTARPDLVLADLVHLFHPELLPDHKLFFYRSLMSPGGIP